MAKYTDEQKKAVLARSIEIGTAAAAEEAGIPVSTVSKWKKLNDAKLSVQIKVEDVKDAVVANKIENQKKKAQRSRKVQEKKDNTKAKVEAAKKPIQKARAAKVDMVFETNGGKQITPEAIAARIPKGADAAYIKLEENKIYWVKGTETGVVDIWEE